MLLRLIDNLARTFYANILRAILKVIDEIGFAHILDGIAMWVLQYYRHVLLKFCTKDAYTLRQHSHQMVYFDNVNVFNLNRRIKGTLVWLKYTRTGRIANQESFKRILLLKELCKNNFICLL